MSLQDLMFFVATLFLLAMTLVRNRVMAKKGWPANDTCSCRNTAATLKAWTGF